MIFVLRQSETVTLAPKWASDCYFIANTGGVG